MARSKAFDPDQVLEKAVEIFWRQGYQKTSMQDLVDYLGINRGSLYDTYGGKRSLYLAALHRYRQINEQRFFELLNQPGSVKKAMSDLFAEFVERSLHDMERKGCFLTNATAEVAPHDPEVAANVAASRDRIIRAIQQTLDRGQQSGEIPPEKDTRALAGYFFNALQGLRIVAKTNPGRQLLNDIVRTTLSVLD